MISFYVWFLPLGDDPLYVALMSFVGIMWLLTCILSYEPVEYFEGCEFAKLTLWITYGVLAVISIVLILWALIPIAIKALAAAVNAGLVNLLG